MQNSPAIVHLTSAHPRNDVRVFHKECLSLQAANFDVTLIVADGKKDALVDGIKIVDVGKSSSRLTRIFCVPWLIYKLAKSSNADIYHLHDPELIPIGLRLLRCGKTVIYDSHEDTPKQILSKPYLNKIFQIVISKIFEVYEGYALKKFSGLIGATPAITAKLSDYCDTVSTINNYPLIDELHSADDVFFERTRVAYVGAISEIRGFKQVLEAMQLTSRNTVLSLAGSFNQKNLENFAREHCSWSKVNYQGQINRDGVTELLSKSFAGIVTFLPYPNHLDAQPNKMFEYMSAGVPVIGSNFSLWKEIIEANNCGICVNPSDPQEIANAIDYLATHPAEVKRMGQNGIFAVRSKYNWSIEEKKLFQFYDLILMGKRQI